MILQKIKFNRGDVIVSVGFFLRNELRPLFEGRYCPRYVEAYEPKIDVYEAYKKQVAPNKRFKVFQKAVSSRDGIGILKLKHTQSTICIMKEETKEFYPVELVSMESVLKGVLDKFGYIDKLLINCEGSEIPIINWTPIELFDKCKFMFVQFHPFLKALRIDSKQVLKCIQKLESCFKVDCISKRYSKYRFWHR
ncbi:MAG: hypothetical protein ACW990_02265 [Promethearchaeota archaeon]|jgi:FkbM family methyltransferase